jgi:hypothetical protein
MTRPGEAQAIASGSGDGEAVPHLLETDLRTEFCPVAGSDV